MNGVLQPWQFLLVVLAGWVNRKQQAVIDFQGTQIQILMEKLGKKRLLLSDDQRRRLAVKAKVLGRKALLEMTTIFTPDTILRWHRQLVAKRWDHGRRGQPVGRPRVSDEIADLVVRIARANPTWGYDRLQGALANLGHTISDQTVGNILKARGIEPAPERKRKTTWKTFLKSHWECLGAMDFTTVEVWTPGGLVTYYLLFVMHVASRRVHFAGCTPNPDDPWMKQIARNLTDCEEGFLTGKRYVIMDRDSKYSDGFRSILDQGGVKPVRLPPRSPNLNPHIERFMLSIKAECLSRLILFGEKMLRRSVSGFLQHYHAERNHQGLRNRLIDAGDEVSRVEGQIACRERLGGLLRYYYREAA